ncbi:MAG TPA: DUF222 domain-containing protein [Acidimicrobiales bacterium]|nr:DUF222 domain-containing protein [Acidimicrobiales bacterium]
MSLTEATGKATNDDRPLELRLAETVGLLNLVTAELVGLIGEALRTGAWEGFGIRSPEHWVVWRCGASPGRARRLVAMARALDRLPQVGALFDAGSLSEDQTAVIVRHTDAEHDHEVAELAPSLTVPQLARILPSLPRAEPEAGADDQPPGSDRATRPTRRSVRFAHGDDGMWWCSIRLPSDEGALVQKGLEVGRDREFRLRNPSRNVGDRGDPGDVSWADALVRLAQTGLDGLDPNTASSRPPGERTQVILHLDADRRVPPRLHLGPVLPPGIADYLSCDSTVRYLLMRHGQPVAMGRRQRSVGRRLRTTIEHRDGGCRVPGCDQSRWLHVHHIVHWTHGGSTDPGNLLCLCAHHHRMAHDGLLTVDGDAGRVDGLTFTDNRGRRLQPAPPRPPRSGTLSAAAAGDHGLPPPRWQHPSGERLDTRWINWN